VLLTYHLPELGTDLVAALASLDVQNLPHVGEQETRSSSSRNKTERTPPPPRREAQKRVTQSSGEEKCQRAERNAV
jgi:hypothetical protein